MEIVTDGGKPDGFYHSRDKRAKYVHYFRHGNPPCNRDCRQDMEVDYPLPEGSTYEICPECLWWYQNFFNPKKHKEKAVV